MDVPRRLGKIDWRRVRLAADVTVLSSTTILRLKMPWCLSLTAIVSVWSLWTSLAVCCCSPRTPINDKQSVCNSCLSSVQLIRQSAQ